MEEKVKEKENTTKGIILTFKKPPNFIAKRLFNFSLVRPERVLYIRRSDQETIPVQHHICLVLQSLACLYFPVQRCYNFFL